MQITMTDAHLVSNSTEARGRNTRVSAIHYPKGQVESNPTSETWHEEGETNTDYKPALPVVIRPTIQWGRTTCYLINMEYKGSVTGYVSNVILLLLFHWK
jgi:hypothetical protein